jgi:hypothetical protein
MPRRVRIVKTDCGPYMGGAVLDAVSGDVIKGVQTVDFHLGIHEHPTAVLRVLAPELNVEALAEVAVDPERLASVLWKKALETRGVAWNSDPVIAFADLPESERNLWHALAQAAFDFVKAFNTR